MNDTLTKKQKRKQEFFRFLKFTAFSCTAGVIQFVTFTLLSEFVFHDADNNFGWSYLIGLILSVVYNFTINRKFTFKSANNIPLAMLEVLGYYAVFTPASTFWGNALTNAGWNEYLVLAFNMIINFISEFLFTRYIVFRKSINTQKTSKKSNKIDTVITTLETSVNEAVSNADNQPIIEGNKDNISKTESDKTGNIEEMNNENISKND